MATLTRAGVEGELVARLKGKLQYVGLSVLTNGTNPDLNGPIRRALAFVGKTSADPVNVVDADVAGLAGWPCEKFFDAATLEALRHILGNCFEVNEEVGNNRQDLSQFADQVQAQIKELEATLQKPYGPGISPTVVAPITTGAPMPNDPWNKTKGTFWPGTWPYPGTGAGQPFP